jgi:hypothetical protein
MAAAVALSMCSCSSRVVVGILFKAQRAVNVQGISMGLQFHGNHLLALDKFRELAIACSRRHTMESGAKCGSDGKGRRSSRS